MLFRKLKTVLRTSPRKWALLGHVLWILGLSL